MFYPENQFFKNDWKEQGIILAVGSLFYLLLDKKAGKYILEFVDILDIECFVFIASKF